MLGLVRACEQARPTLKQARVLTAREVLSLETLFIEGSLHEVDRFGLGCFLFLIFACCRLSDVSYLDSLALDVPDKALRSDNPGYLEAQSTHHKTQRVKSKQGVPLVMVAPIRGLHRTAWGTIFHGQCMVHRKALMAGTTSPLLTGINADG